MTPYPGKIVVASIDGEYTVKRFVIDKQGQGWLMPEGPNYPPLKINEGSEFSIFGVVTRCLHHLVRLPKGEGVFLVAFELFSLASLSLPSRVNVRLRRP